MIEPLIQRAEFVPRILIALVVIIVTWLAAKFGQWLVGRAGRSEWIERALTRSGIFAGLLEPTQMESRLLAGTLLYWGVLSIGAGVALAVLSDRMARRIGDLVLVLLPNTLVAIAIIAVAWWLGGYWARSVLIWMSNEGVAYPWRWAAAARAATLSVGIALASEATGFATTLIRSAFLIVLAGGTFAVAQAALPIFKRHLEAMLSPGATDREKQLDDQLMR